jgi:gluconokinase
MSTFPTSPNEKTRGMLYFPRMLDKIRRHARGELDGDYHLNLGRRDRADGACCNFLRVSHGDLRQRVLAGGTDEEVLDWCFENGRRLNDGDLVIWNGFVSKLGWRDFAAPWLAEAKKKAGIDDREDIMTIPEMINFDEGRMGENQPGP